MSNNRMKLSKILLTVAQTVSVGANDGAAACRPVQAPSTPEQPVGALRAM